MKKLLSLLIVMLFSSPVFSSEYAEITGLTLSSGKGLVGSPLTIEATADGSNLLYKFWANTKGICHKPNQDPNSSHWVVLQDWSSGPICTWTPEDVGSYTLVVWVSEDPDATCTNMIGAGFVVEEMTVNTGGDYRAKIENSTAIFEFNLTLTQAGNTFTGTIVDPVYTGTLSGTILSNATANFTLVLTSPCTGTFTGTAAITDDGEELSGVFTGSEDCLGASVTTLTLTKQQP